MSRIASLVLFGMLFASHTQAEIFKCVGKDGLDLYQNFPCQFDSMGWVPDAPGTKAAPPPASTRAPETRNVVRGIDDAQKRSSETEARPDVSREVRPGMTFDDVRERWGEPEETRLEEPGQGSRSEVWTYANARTVRFDHKGRVSALKQ
jgi:hypothetical protein